MNNTRYANCEIDHNLTILENTEQLQKRYNTAWNALELTKKLNRPDERARVLTQITTLRNNISKLLDMTEIID